MCAVILHRKISSNLFFLFSYSGPKLTSSFPLLRRTLFQDCTCTTQRYCTPPAHHAHGMNTRRAAAATSEPGVATQRCDTTLHSCTPALLHSCTPATLCLQLRPANCVKQVLLLTMLQSNILQSNILQSLLLLLLLLLLQQIFNRVLS